MAAPPKGGRGKQHHPKGGGGEITTTNLGWCSFFSPFSMVLPFFPSSGWCCSGFSSFGSWCFHPARFGLVLLFRDPAGRQLDQKKEEVKLLHPKKRQEKAAPLKGRRRDHHSTELNTTQLQPIKLISILPNFFGKKAETAPPPKGEQGKSTPTPRRTGMGAPPKRSGELLPPLLLSGGASSLSLRFPSGGASFLYLLLFGAAVPLFRMK